MSFHYLIEIEPFAAQDSIRDGVINHNLKNISDFRIDYLGRTRDKEKGISDKLLITGLCTQMNNLKQFDDILIDFFSCVEFYLPDTYRGDTAPYLGFRQVTIREVSDYYGQLERTIDRKWFPNGTKLKLSVGEAEELYGSIRALYFDFNMQYQLCDDLRKEYDAYMANRVRKMEFTEEQKNKEKEIREWYKFLTPCSEVPKYDFKEKGISYGRYPITFSHKDVVIPPYKTKIKFETDMKDYAFSNCEIIETICIWENMNYFGQGVFENCINLKKAAFKNNMEELPCGTFYNCTSLTEVELPETIKLIGGEAFNGCTALSDANFLANTCVEKIDGAAFYGCIGLETIGLPNTLQEIGSSAFENCYKLTSIDLSECTGLKRIPYSCFRECKRLQSIKLPEGLTQIDSNAFSGCAKLNNITIPSTVTEISFDVFKDCSNLESITFLCSDIILDSYDFDKDTIVYCKEGSVVHKMAVGMEWSFKLI